jgi:hypothetical protein
MRGFWRRFAVFGLAGVMSMGLLTADFSSPRAALATTSAGQSDPAWDFGRGGAEVQGQPECYMPAPSITQRKMYNLSRPSCFPGHMQ